MVLMVCCILEMILCVVQCTAKHYEAEVFLEIPTICIDF